MNRQRRTEEERALLVLLQVLKSEAGVAGGQQIQKGCVAIPVDAVGGEGSLVRAQALTDYPALHSWVKAIFKEHLETKKPARVNDEEGKVRCNEKVENR